MTNIANRNTDMLCKQSKPFTDWKMGNLAWQQIKPDE